MYTSIIAIALSVSKRIIPLAHTIVTHESLAHTVHVVQLSSNSNTLQVFCVLIYIKQSAHVFL